MANVMGLPLRMGSFGFWKEMGIDPHLSIADDSTKRTTAFEVPCFDD
jgi:hypothetical protein